MGDVPEIFISAIRADSPHFSILDRPIQYYLKYFGDNCENSLTYLVLSMKKLISVPKFILLNLTKCTIFQAINNFL